MHLRSSKNDFFPFHQQVDAQVGSIKLSSKEGNTDGTLLILECKKTLHSSGVLSACILEKEELNKFTKSQKADCSAKFIEQK